MKISKLTAFLLALFCLCGLWGCSASQDESTSGQLILGTSADYPPFEYHLSIGGQDIITGADIQLAKKIAADMGKELVIKEIPFEQLLDELNVGTVDMVISNMVATDERLAEADASNSYYTEAAQRVVFLKKHTAVYTKFAALEGKKVGVQKGSIQMTLAGKQLPDCQVVLYSSVADMFLALSAGDIDAVLVSGSTADSYVAINDTLNMIKEDYAAEDGSCVWVAKDDPKGLLESINTSVDYVKINNMMAGWLEEFSGLTN